jgi:photosystem II stability/assembly factor-like uncharacterized protein
VRFSEDPARPLFNLRALPVNSMPEEAAGLWRGAWTPRGPDNIAGVVTALVVHPMEPRSIIFGTRSGGIWKSVDAGTNWFHLDGYPDLDASRLAIDPRSPKILYAASLDFTSLGGLFRSIDGGQTWAHLAQTASWRIVEDIAITPGTPPVVMVAVRMTLDESLVPHSGGIYRSEDQGETWSNVLPAGAAYSVAADPANPQLAIAVATIRDQREGFEYRDGPLFSTDAGLTWTPADGPSVARYDEYGGGGIFLAYAQRAPEIVYLIAPDGALWRSENGGKAYTRRSASSRELIGPPILVPTTGDFLLCGSLPLLSSSDGGRSFSVVPSRGQVDPILGWDFLNHDNRSLAAVPGFDGASHSGIIVGNDHGIFTTENIFKSISTSSGWHSLNLGLQTTQFYSCDGDARSGIIIGGTQDNGTPRVDLSSMHSPGGLPLLYADSGAAAVDPDDSRFCYFQTQNLVVARSVDGCRSMDRVISFNLPDSGAYSGPDKGSSAFLAPILLDPNDSHRLFAGGASLWVSDNVRSTAPSWKRIRQPDSMANTSAITAIAVAAGDSNTIWVGQADGQVFKTSNGLSASPVWERVGENQFLLPGISRILIDWHDRNRAFIASDGGGAQSNLLKTTDGGLTWDPIFVARTDGSSSERIHALAQHPSMPDWFYIGTESGIYASEDGGDRWSSSDLGPATVPTRDLKFMHHSHLLLAGTYGRGLWTADTSKFEPGASCVSDNQTLCLNHNRFRVFTTWHDGNGRSGLGHATSLTADSGYFWFFDPANVEVVVKVLDGCNVNSEYWTFAAGLTNVEVGLFVLDTQTGVVKTYNNPANTAFQPIQDTSAFAACVEGQLQAAVSRSEVPEPAVSHRPDIFLTSTPTPLSSCISDTRSLCLNEQRFRITADWETATESGSGIAVALTDDTGYFWFFSPENLEVVAKVLDGCGFSSSYWLFAGGLTNVKVTLTVTDTRTGSVKTYINPAGTPFQAIQDTSAFATCP